MKIKKVIAPIFITLLLTVIDQISKYLASVKLMFCDDIMVLPGVLSLTYHENRGAAFGLFQGGRWFFLIFALIIFGAIIYYYVKLPEGKVYGWIKVFLVLVLAGALGNSVDRLINGYVVDFLQFEFINFPIFNIADVYVVCGTFLLAWAILFFVKDEPVEAKEIKDE
ncbi:signal peptidase II [Tyzzerella sp. OttesenSCG-928-J15]|nr:signal peptidase II [Tyzzerella sp. OttesenSCG-928-J15]